MDRKCLDSGYNIEVPVEDGVYDLSIIDLDKNIRFFKQLVDSEGTIVFWLLVYG